MSSIKRNSEIPLFLFLYDYKTYVMNLFKRCMVKVFFVFSVILGFYLNAFAQAGQIDIPRVAEMPALPSPYIMRDWKTVATQYDELVFSTNATGEYLPLVSFKATGINYPALQPILLDTYVGTASHGNQAEAINIIPALVGATLMGIDKSNQDGINWVLKSKDFFNAANGENVYLNGYSAHSGSDWWYDLMPNVFFYQLYFHYPNIPGFEDQFISIADRWLEAVYAMGGSTNPWQVPEMNYRAWKLATMTPNTNGVVEPEAAGAMAWILYQAWIHTSDKKYLTGAELAMEFLSGLDSNPSYELQLSYGALAAARMNAELGTTYDLPKIVNWCFDRGPLRGWGVIAGTWNGSDVSGLTGEANDAGNDYAFAMNGFQQAATLVPMVKYDKRFARDIAKWTLNLSNASRLFYPAYLPEADQDDYAWSNANDPRSVIAYEALKENWNGNALYGTGDAKRNGWAETNLGLYGSSHVGYLAAIVEPTNVEGILKLDLNATDFFGKNDFPSFLIYNPHPDARQVTIALGTATHDIYDAISETVIQSGVTGDVSVEVAPGEARLLVYLPAGAALEARDEKLFLGESVVDYHYGYDFSGKFRIKSLSAVDSIVEFNQAVVIHTVLENAPGAVTYTWYVDNVLSGSSTDPAFTWTAPEATGLYTIKLEVSSGTVSSQDSLVFRVVENIPKSPVISGFSTDSLWYHAGSHASVICETAQDGGEIVLYSWTLPDGTIVNQQDALLAWSVPEEEGLYRLSCEVTNADGLKSASQKSILVKKKMMGVTTPFAYYPLDGNVLDYSGHGHHATREGAQPAVDPRGESGKAYRFSSGNDIIFIPNETSLNFTDRITLAFWVKLDAVTEEAFILSHGSWEERWKVSVTPEKKLRWTVKTSSGTTDLDSSFPLALGRYYHFAVVYSGYSMELYADGVLDTFVANTGAMAVTSKALTFGRKDTGTTDYSLKGTLDEVRIYDQALSPEEIKMLMSVWNKEVTAVDNEVEDGIAIYPNPSGGIIYISSNKNVTAVSVWDLAGRKTYELPNGVERYFVELNIGQRPGIFILKIETTERVFYKKIRIGG